MSVYIAKRTVKDGSPRFLVRFQASHFAPSVHLGSFKTRTEAVLRQTWALHEIAAGRVPDRAAITRKSTVKTQTLAEVTAAYLETRIDAGASSVLAYRQRLEHAVDEFGDRDPASLTSADLQAWIISMEAAPRSVRSRVSALRQVLDYAGVSPNPCRDTGLRMPRHKREQILLPPSEHVALILGTVAAQHRGVIRLMRDAGLRVGEACALEWRDVDPARERVFVREAKTPSGVRWVQLGAVPEHLQVRRQFVRTLGEVPTPPEGRASRRVFPGGPDAVRSAIARACEKHKLPRYSPHDLRHLHASRLLADGWSPADVAARLGHSSPALTLSVYAHCVAPD